MLIIESFQNRTVKKINSLKTASRREEYGLFLVEGERLVAEISPKTDVWKYVLAESYFNKHGYGKFDPDKTYILVDSVFGKITETVAPQGVLAVCRQRDYTAEYVLQNTKLVCILENVTDPGNLGTIIRTAYAAGADCVVLSRGCVDLHNPKVVRATMGAIFHLPIIKDANLADVIDILKNNGSTVFAAHLNGKNVYESGIGTKPSAILIGNEAVGLTEDAASLADSLVKIPMPGRAESLNASVAAGILIYETVRRNCNE